MNMKNKKLMLVTLSITFVLSLTLYLIYLEEKQFKENKLSLLSERAVITNDNTSFEVSEENNLITNTEEEIDDIERLEKLDNFLNVIYKLNKNDDCDLTNVIFKSKSGRITHEELFTPYNLNFLNVDWYPKKDEFYSYEGQENIKNEYEKKISKFLQETGKIDEKGFNYQVIKTEQESLKFYEEYFGINPSLSEISDYSRVSNKILSVNEENPGNNLLTAIVISNEPEEKKCTLSEIKEIINVTEDSDYIYVYISYLKYDSTKINESVALEKAIEEGANYKLLLKKDKNKYYLDRYEYLK